MPFPAIDCQPLRVVALSLSLLVVAGACRQIPRVGAAPASDEPPTADATAAGDAPLVAAPSATATATPVATPVATANATPSVTQPAAESAVEPDLVALLAGMGVRLMPDAAALEVAGRVNMDRGPVEVFACAPGGKTHEAVVLMECVPSAVHAGLLALGLEPGRPFARDADGAVQAPTGDGVRVALRWTDAAGEAREARAEDWVWDVPAGRAMEHAAWIFAGSYERSRRDGSGGTRYAADSVGSLVAIYHDASAVLENPWPGADDTRYHANVHAVPPVGTPLTLRFSADR